ncbi:MAG: phosphotransferase [Xanthomonadales bacterium]|nr:phosphotransferase [Xanthomonadales bacterium]
MYKPAVINDGMMQKYGLRTSVMRILVTRNAYALIELELHASSQRQMQAVWVGREEYQQFRNWDEGEADPIEAWLAEQESGVIPELRPPWLTPGWYKQAEAWIGERLMKAGIQMSGSVQQFKAGWPSACLLRVRTVQGQYFFKAAYAKPPGEARLTQVLAGLWPDIVPEPFAVDQERNWMLMPDYGVTRDNQPGHGDYAKFATTLGRFQLEATSHMDTWLKLGCPVMDLGFMQNKDGRAGMLMERVRHALSGSPEPLDEQEIDQLHRAVEQARARCAALAGFSLPDTLSHLDFRPDNFFLSEGKCRLIDWADVAVTHPFIALCQTFHFFDKFEGEDSERHQQYQPDPATREAMERAYLEAFSGILPQAKAAEAFELAMSVMDYFWFLYTASQLEIIEPGSVLADAQHHRARTTARALIAQLES